MHLCMLASKHDYIGLMNTWTCREWFASVKQWSSVVYFLAHKASMEDHICFLYSYNICMTLHLMSSVKKKTVLTSHKIDWADRDTCRIRICGHKSRTYTSRFASITSIYVGLLCIYCCFVSPLSSHSSVLSPIFPTLIPTLHLCYRNYS